MDNKLRDAYRELERWRHGVTIEGDFVCDAELACANIARPLRDLVDEFRPDQHNPVQADAALDRLLEAANEFLDWYDQYMVLSESPGSGATDHDPSG